MGKLNSTTVALRKYPVFERNSKGEDELLSAYLKTYMYVHMPLWRYKGLLVG